MQKKEALRAEQAADYMKIENTVYDCWATWCGPCRNASARSGIYWHCRVG